VGKNGADAAKVMGWCRAGVKATRSANSKIKVAGSGIGRNRQKGSKLPTGEKIRGGGKGGTKRFDAGKKDTNAKKGRQGNKKGREVTLPMRQRTRPRVMTKRGGIRAWN